MIEPREPIDPLRIYTMAEVAELVLRHDVTWFYRHRKALKSKGFPKPVSPIGHPRWDGLRLIAWLQREEPAEPAKPDQGAEVVDFSERLRQRAKAICAPSSRRRNK